MPITEKKHWQGYAAALKELLDLDCEPVGISCRQADNPDQAKEKVRICRAVLQAAKGASLNVSKENNACFGASWHLGFQKIDNPKILAMIKKFVVEGEKLFSSYPALDNLISQMQTVPDNARAFFQLSPLKDCTEEPQLVIFVCNPEAACRLLTLVTFSDGTMPKIKIGGPTCRMAIIYPLLSGEVNLSFYDYTARKMCNVEKDKLLISIPYKRIAQIVEAIDKCTAGSAKMEYPAEFREFLQKRLAQ